MATYGIPGTGTYSQTLSGLDELMATLPNNTINQITARNMRDVNFTMYEMIQSNLAANLFQITSVGNTTSFGIQVGGLQVTGTSSFSKNIQLKSTITDSFGATGPVGYVLASINGGVSWTQSISSLPSLQQVTNVGYTTSNNINFRDPASSTNYSSINYNSTIFANLLVGTESYIGMYNSGYNNNGIFFQYKNTALYLGATLSTGASNSYSQFFQNKSGTIALLSDVVAASGSQNLQSVLDNGNTASSDINIYGGHSISLYSDSAGLKKSLYIFDNGYDIYNINNSLIGQLNYSSDQTQLSLTSNTDVGNTYTARLLAASGSSALIFTGKVGGLTIKPATNSSFRTILFPDNNGTVALLSDITSGGGSQSLQQVTSVGNTTSSSIILTSVSGGSTLYVQNASNLTNYSQIYAGGLAVQTGNEFIQIQSNYIQYSSGSGGNAFFQFPVSVPAAGYAYFLPSIGGGTIALASQEINITSTASCTINSTVPSRDSTVYVNITAQSGGVTFNNPTGTWSNNQILIIRILDNGTSATMSYGNKFRGGMLTLQSATTPNQTLRQEFVYNSAGTITWDLIGQVYN